MKWMSELFFIVVLIQSATAGAETNSVNKWNIVIYSFKPTTAEAEDVSFVIPRSLKSALEDVEYFNVEMKTNVLKSRKDLEKAYLEGYDIAVSGKVGTTRDGKLFAYVKAVDIVSKITKMENFYEGKAGIDVFETIDEIIPELKRDILKNVKPMTQEEIVKYRVKRVLVSKDITLKRIFKTYHGLCFSEPYNVSPYISYDIYLSHFNFSLTLEVPMVLSLIYAPYLQEKGYLSTKEGSSMMMSGGISFPEFAAGVRFGRYTVDLAFVLHFHTFSTYQGFCNDADGKMVGLKFKAELGKGFSGTAGIYYLLTEEDVSLPMAFLIGADYMFSDSFGLAVQFVPLQVYIPEYEETAHNFQLFLGVVNKTEF